MWRMCASAGFRCAENWLTAQYGHGDPERTADDERDAYTFAIPSGSTRLPGLAAHGASRADGICDASGRDEAAADFGGEAKPGW